MNDEIFHAGRDNQQRDITCELGLLINIKRLRLIDIADMRNRAVQYIFCWVSLNGTIALTGDQKHMRRVPMYEPGSFPDIRAWAAAAS